MNDRFLNVCGCFWLFDLTLYPVTNVIRTNIYMDISVESVF